MPKSENSQSLSFDKGSFRDRTSRVLVQKNHIYRVLDKEAVTQWQLLKELDFYKASLDSNKIVQTSECDIADFIIPNHLTSQWEVILEHKKIPFISYPYEWSFEMLKDAALLHLELIENALHSNMILKDASSYNVQWLGCQPVFIDVASFVQLPEGSPWVAYGQFCELFLFPLLLQAHKDIAFQPWLRGSLEGIKAEELTNVFSFRDNFRSGVLLHVKLQAKLQNKYNNSKINAQKTMKQAGFKKELIDHNVASLKSLIGKLQWNKSKSTWSNYTSEHNYSDQDMEEKISIVRTTCKACEYKTVFDLGCNTGTFSRIAAETANHVVAMDFDPLAIDHLYRSLKLEGNSKIQPLIGNIADPSPSLGWRNKERKSFSERAAPDLVLALALIHHLVIGANVPLDEAVEWFVSLGGDLLIEFVDTSDSMTKTLLLNKENHYADYTKVNFEALLAKHYVNIKVYPLKSGNRTLYYATQK